MRFTLTAACLFLLAFPALAGPPQEDPPPDDPPPPGEPRQVDASKVLLPGTTLDVTQPPRAWRGEPVSLSLRDADLIEVLRSFAKIADVNLIIDPSVKGTVTVELHEVPWDQALYVILKTHGLGLEVSGNVWSTWRRPGG